MVRPPRFTAVTGGLHVDLTTTGLDILNILGSILLMDPNVSSDNPCKYRGLALSYVINNGEIVGEGPTKWIIR